MANQRKFYRLIRHSSRGFSLIEVLVALAILGLVAVAFLGGLATANKAMFIADKRTTAESLARTEMEYVKNCSYEYGASPIYERDFESPTHAGYFISVDAPPIDPDTGTPLVNPSEDIGIQKITVTVSLNEPVITLVDYKVNR